MDSERNIIAVRKVVALRESATICRQITFVRDTGEYIAVLALAHASRYHTDIRSGNAGCRIVRQVEMPFPSAKHEATPANGRILRSLYSRVICARTEIPASSFFFYAQAKYFPGLTRFSRPRIGVSILRSCLHAYSLNILQHFVTIKIHIRTYYFEEPNGYLRRCLYV